VVYYHYTVNYDCAKQFKERRMIMSKEIKTALESVLKIIEEQISAYKAINWEYVNCGSYIIEVDGKTLRLNGYHGVDGGFDEEATLFPGEVAKHSKHLIDNQLPSYPGVCKKVYTSAEWYQERVKTLNATKIELKRQLIQLELD
jgi:hypothetical protein